MNSDYIREKRKKKFSVLWDAKVPRLPVISADDSESKAIDIKDKRYYFNKKTTKSGEVYLVCRIGRLADGKEKFGVTELVYYVIYLSIGLPVIVGVLFTLLHALIQAYVLTMLTATYFGEVTEPAKKKGKRAAKSKHKETVAA